MRFIIREPKTAMRYTGIKRCMVYSCMCIYIYTRYSFISLAPVLLHRVAGLHIKLYRLLNPKTRSLMQQCFASSSLLLFRQRAKHCASLLKTPVINIASTAHLRSTNQQPMAQKTVRNPLTVASNGISNVNLDDTTMPTNGTVSTTTPTNVNGDTRKKVEEAQPYTGKNPDGTWGPYGLYCGRIPESRLITCLLYTSDAADD